jgi:uncharacterized protein (TIGR02118 family)
MAKMIAIYKTPKDIDAFEDHYFNVHIPLANQLPGLIKYEINDGAILSTTGHNDVFRVATLYFETMEALKAAFASDIGMQCAADRKILADNEHVQIYLFDTKEA